MSVSLKTQNLPASVSLLALSLCNNCPIGSSWWGISVQARAHPTVPRQDGRYTGNLFTTFSEPLLSHKESTPFWTFIFFYMSSWSDKNCWSTSHFLACKPLGSVFQFVHVMRGTTACANLKGNSWATLFLLSQHGSDNQTWTKIILSVRAQRTLSYRSADPINTLWMSCSEL